MNIEFNSAQTVGMPLLKSITFLFALQGLFYGDTIIVRISGNLNMANATTLINRIEAIFTEEEPQISWMDNQVGHQSFEHLQVCKMKLVTFLHKGSVTLPQLYL